jgi:hypothetical protein
VFGAQRRWSLAEDNRSIETPPQSYNPAKITSLPQRFFIEKPEPMNERFKAVLLDTGSNAKSKTNTPAPSTVKSKTASVRSSV